MIKDSCLRQPLYNNNCSFACCGNTQKPQQIKSKLSAASCASKYEARCIHVKTRNKPGRQKIFYHK